MAGLKWYNRTIPSHHQSAVYFFVGGDREPARAYGVARHGSGGGFMAGPADRLDPSKVTSREAGRHVNLYVSVMEDC